MVTELDFKVVPETEQEGVMEPTISVCRKGDDLYLTLEGDFHHISSQQLFQALKRFMLTSLKCFAADSSGAFSFKTHGKVRPVPAAPVPGARGNR